MKLKDIKFLTTNKQKAKDFTSFGLGVKEFDKEIDEVLSADVEEVVLHKARDTGLNHIVVEDTALYVDGASFFGTQIKYVYDAIKDDDSYNGHKSIWKVSLCMKTDDKYYIATGKLEGILKYPIAPEGYHFNRVFAVKDENNNYIHFENLTKEKKEEVGPRFLAIKKLIHAIETNNYADILILNESQVKNWDGKYQSEFDIVNEKKIGLKK